MIGMALGQMLEDMGHEVCAIVTTEAGAIDAAILRKPDLMIVDAHLSEGSGVAAVETILRTRATPYFFISGSKVPTARPGATVLEKPFFEPELQQAIKQAIEGGAPS